MLPPEQRPTPEGAAATLGHVTHTSTRMHGTTIVAVNRGGVSALAGDGQVSLGDTIVKRGAVKVRTLADGAVLVGFAGAVSDAFTLLDKFDGHLSASRNNLLKAAVETVKEWRTDRVLRNLEAMLLVANRQQILSLSGHGDVIIPDEGVAAVGSGGPYAQAAALALLRATDLEAGEIARRALAIAGEIDVYTSGSGTVLEVGGKGGGGDADGSSDADSGDADSAGDADSQASSGAKGASEEDS